MTPIVEGFFDPATNTVTYVVSDPDSRRCAIIDPVLDFDPKSGRTSSTSADRVIAHIKDQGLSVDWLLETHIHADHLSAGPYLKEHLGGQIGIGAAVPVVQQTFKKLFNLGDDFTADGSQFDILFGDGETLPLGALEGRVMNTPGHTPACVTYVFGDAAFVGDTLFMPDYGTARCDFPGGDARILYASVRRILGLPVETRIFTCHDYGTDDRDFAWLSSVAQQRSDNIHIGDGIGVDDFVKMREGRDAELEMPVLILPSVQVNMRAGKLPTAEDNGISYLKIPVNGI
ncbi:MAG: MBL fold metallo-hydrolase [Rhodospirillaceae bacterium]|nr:MBL fold metallo-hydrolase [Rhodospirillaceae bacterium]